MVFFLFFSFLCIIGNISIHSKEYFFHPNPNYFFVSTHLSNQNKISLTNSLFSHSFYPSFFLIKSTLFEIKNSYFNYFLQSAILSNDAVIHSNLECNKQININIKDEIFSIENCVFDSIGTENSNGAIRIQNAKNVFISKCNFIKCKANQGCGGWFYSITNITMIKSQFIECRSGDSGSSALVIMNSHFNISQLLISNCYEGSYKFQTGVVFIVDSSGYFCRSSFINNTCLLSENDRYAYIAFLNCPSVDITDICFCYPNQRVGLYFIKIYLENSHYSVQNVVLPLFESALDNIVLTINSFKKINNKENYILNNTQNQICHIDNYVFEIGVPPTPIQSPIKTLTNTPAKTPVKTPKETPIETPKETPIETPAETPKETPTETPFETPTETPFETPTKTPKETPTETPFETQIETIITTPLQTHFGATSVISYEAPSETLIEDLSKIPTDSSTENDQQTEMLIDQSDQYLDSTKVASINFIVTASKAQKTKSQPFYSYPENSTEMFSNEISSMADQTKEPKDYTVPLIASIVGVIILILIIIIIILLVLHCKKKNKDAYDNENTESSVDYEVQFKISNQEIKPNPSI